MDMKELYLKYDRLQKKFGDKKLHSIYNGGCMNNPDICFVFMNPTGRNVAAYDEWNGIRAPWIGTKNIWDLFYSVNLMNKEVYDSIKNRKGSEWDEEFSELVYKDIEKHKVFITNLGKCTQVDARSLPDSVYLNYLKLLEREIEIVNPKVIVLLGNQVSSIVLNKKISVSTCRKELFIKTINKKDYKFYSVFYPVGNGRFNIDKSIEDIKYILESIK